MHCQEQSSIKFLLSRKNVGCVGMWKPTKVAIDVDIPSSHVHHGNNVVGEWDWLVYFNGDCPLKFFQY